MKFIKLIMIFSKYKHFYSWWNLRFYTILFTPILCIELEFFFLLQSLVFSHIVLGLKNIIKDYINNIFLQIIYLSTFRILSIEFIRLNLEFWF